MPNPAKLRVNDRVKFIELPSEWTQNGFKVQPDDVEFMKMVISRGYYQRIYMVDEYGKPWIRARLKVGKKYEDHTWAIFEKTGWIKKKRSPTK